MRNYVCGRLRGFYEFFRLKDLEFANAFYLDGIRIWHLTMHAQKVA